MRKFSFLFIIFLFFLIILSSTWIFYVSLDKRNSDLLNKMVNDLRFKNILFVKSIVPKIERKYNLVITKAHYIPWGIYIKYEDAKTLLDVEFDNKNYYYNQKFVIMEKYLPFDNTIKVEGTNNIGIIKDILNNFNFIKIRRIKFYDKYFEIYGDQFILKLNIKDYQEKKKYVIYLIKNFDLKGKSLDFRFRIPFIGGN